MPRSVLLNAPHRFPASQYNNLTRYVKIAAFLPDKNITEVAKRYQWMVVSSQQHNALLSKCSLGSHLTVPITFAQELQRLNSINFSDEPTRGDLPGRPASPSESSSLNYLPGFAAASAADNDVCPALPNIAVPVGGNENCSRGQVKGAFHSTGKGKRYAAGAPKQAGAGARGRKARKGAGQVRQICYTIQWTLY